MGERGDLLDPTFSSFKALKEVKERLKRSSRSRKSADPRQQSLREKAARFINLESSELTSVAEKAGQFIPSCAIFSVLLLSFLFNQQQSRFMFGWSKTAALTAEIQPSLNQAVKHSSRRRGRGGGGGGP